VQIRKISRPDFESLLVLGRLMHEESSYRHLEYNKEKLWQLGEKTIFEPRSYFGVVAEKDAEIVGMFLGYITPFFFSSQKIAGDLVLFVTPKERGSSVALRLIREYEAWAIANGAKQIMLGVTTGVNEERTKELFLRLGYKPAGAIVKKEV